MSRCWPRRVAQYGMEWRPTCWRARTVRPQYVLLSCSTSFPQRSEPPRPKPDWLGNPNMSTLESLTELQAFIVLNALPNIGPITLNRLLEELGGDPRAI